MTLSFSVGEQRPAGRDEHPFRIVVLADLQGSRSVSGPFRLGEAADFTRLIQKLEPRLVVEVPNRLCSSPPRLELKLTLGTLKDLSPDSLVEGLEPARRVTRLVEQLQAVVDGKAAPDDALEASLDSCADLEALREAVELCREVRGAGPSSDAAPGARPAARRDRSEQDASVDRILGMVDVPGVEKRAAAAIGSLVSSVGQSGRAGKCQPQIQQALELAIGALGAQLDALLHAPELQRLERAWRGLKVLVDAVDFRRALRLEVIQATKGELASVLREQVVEPSLGGAAPPPGLIVAPLLLSTPGGDAELLQQLAEQAEALQAPVLTSIGHGYLELDAGRDASALRYVGTLFDKPAYTKWNSLRQKGCARWIAVAFNRFLLRALHEKKGRAQKLPYSETAASDADRPWGDPVWAIAALAARSFARCGWATQITGTDDGRLDDLPIHEFEEGTRALGQIPLEAFLSRELIQDLETSGIGALFSPLDHDSAFLLHAPTLFHSVTRSGGRSPSLPYQLLASRIALHLNDLLPGLEGRGSPGEVKSALEAALLETIADTGAGASATAQVDLEAGRHVVHLEIHTGRGVLRGAGLELDFSISA